jgi:hypothetical protein
VGDRCPCRRQRRRCRPCTAACGSRLAPVRLSSHARAAIRRATSDPNQTP